MMNCKLIINSYSPFLQQIYAGFCELEAAKKIHLEIVKSKYFTAENELKPFVEVIIDNQINVVIDTFDQGHLFAEKKLTIKPDFYFKRSYSDELKHLSRFGDVVYPLGFNYYVTSYNDWIMPPQRQIKGKIKRLLEYPDRLLGTSLSFNCNIVDYEHDPTLDDQCRILFTTRLWAPDEFQDLSAEELKNRSETNELRVMVIRLLRKEYPEQFLGGVERTPFTEKYYSDCLLESNDIFQRRNYFRNIKTHDICISTSGLFHANGWKFAEYCAASRAIISEKMYYGVTGKFSPSTNYLEFNDEKSLIDSVHTLINNSGVRLEMMRRNREYYDNFVRPDKLVSNILNVIKGNNWSSF